MTFKPAPINNGFTFVRVDLEGSPIIEADANYVVNTQRGTNLEKLRSKNSNLRTRFGSFCRM
jgi:UDP-3-O-[3-hydroxymyristoyl] N-acetylglucosamine deacetylase/3-hydroxyacyl-[acyl-carrier-protein] dehydratase